MMRGASWTQGYGYIKGALAEILSRDIVIRFYDIVATRKNYFNNITRP